MNRKQLTMVLILGLVLGGAGLYLYQRNATSWKAGEQRLGQKLIADFPINEVAHIQIKQASEVNLVKSGDIWNVRERYDYPADFSQISEFLRKTWEMKIVQSVGVGPSQLGRLELLSPANQTNSSSSGTGTLVDFKDKSGKTIKTLLLGKKHMRQADSSSSFGGEGWPDGRYVLVLNQHKDAAVISDPLSSIEPKPEQWLNKDFFKVEKLKSVSVTHTNATNSWKLERETESGEMKLADAKEGEQLDTSKSSGIGSALSYPNFTDVVSPQARTDETGMDTPIVATLETFDHFVYTVKLGKASGEDNYHLQMSLKADIPKQRAAAKDEKPEDKERLDKEFQDKVKSQQEKLHKEQAFEKWTYLVSKWTVDPLLKERAQLLAEKKEEPKQESQPESKPESNSPAKPQETKSAIPLPPLPPLPPQPPQ